MSIKPAIDELEQLNAEITRNNASNKKLRQRMKVLEQQIAEYLQHQATGGVKYNGRSVVLETRDHHPIKSKSQKEQAVHDFFQDLGVADPKQAVATVARRWVPRTTCQHTTKPPRAPRSGERSDKVALQ